jgi:hypothetical protein
MRSVHGRTVRGLVLFTGGLPSPGRLGSMLCLRAPIATRPKGTSDDH